MPDRLIPFDIVFNLCSWRMLNFGRNFLTCTRDNERYQAQLGTVGSILEENVRLQQKLVESKQLCSQLQLRLTVSNAAQPNLQQARDASSNR
mmetsp:Transcript_41008/g.85592  ORF Transcript_41008/g.85592 Transcript_41008/m.85592 type:complete len:92 (+) Transcript_41008:165-440(+)